MADFYATNKCPSQMVVQPRTQIDSPSLTEHHGWAPALRSSPHQRGGRAIPLSSRFATIILSSSFRGCALVYYKSRLCVPTAELCFRTIAVTAQLC